jgi:hypothetical protein
MRGVSQMRRVPTQPQDAPHLSTKLPLAGLAGLFPAGTWSWASAHGGARRREDPFYSYYW